jgi:hypothetical protein
MKKAISITLTSDNLLWLRGQAARTAKGNVSEVVDRLIGEARSAGRTHPAAIRSVVGTIDLPDDDSLEQADGYVRAMFERSLSRPLLVRERPPKPRSTSAKATVDKGRRG